MRDASIHLRHKNKQCIENNASGRNRLPVSALPAPRLQAGLTRGPQAGSPLAPPFDSFSKVLNAPRSRTAISTILPL